MKSSLLIFIFILLSSLVYGTTGDINKAKSFLSTSKWAFEENRGQVTGADSAKVTYFYKKGDMTMFLTKTGIAYQFDRSIYPEGYTSMNKQYLRLSGEDFHKNREKFDSLRKLIKYESYRMDIELLGANPHAEILREGESPDYMQYYNHNVLGVHSYQKIIYKNIYPNIDWVIYLNNKTSNDQLNSPAIASLSSGEGRDEVKYDFIVHPGGNPADIKLKTHWVEDLKLNPDGSLTLKNRMGSITDQKPISFQNAKSIETNFNLIDNIISFKITNYDKNNELKIDPKILWETFYGGENIEWGSGCSADKYGNVYLCGSSSSLTNISSGGYQNSFNGNAGLNGFLVKFNSFGARIWATYYGGEDHSNGVSCTTDTFGNIYMIGSTSSNTNISYNGFQNNKGGGVNAFLVKFNFSGTRIWATYYGGNNNTEGTDCTVDNVGNIYIVGSTSSTTNIASNGFKNIYSDRKDAFLVKFTTSGLRIWGSYYGGNGSDYGNSCSVDKFGNVILSGNTTSDSNIAYNGFQNSIPQSIGSSFIVKFSSSGARIWATYFSGFDNNICKSTFDINGNVYLSGYCNNSQFKSFNGFQDSFGGGESDAFLAKFSNSGALLWSTWYGGSKSEEGFDCITDSFGNVYMVGFSDSNLGIAEGGFKNNSEVRTTFIVKFNSSGDRMWGSYLNMHSIARSIFTDNIGNIYIAGYANESSNFSYNAFQNKCNGTQDAFIVKIKDTSFPTIKINGDDTICMNSLTTFYSDITDGGNYPKYFWYNNSKLVDTNNNYTTSNLSYNDTIVCLLISSLKGLLKDSVWSNKLIMKVEQADTTIINKSTCSNQPFLFNGNYLLTSGTYLDTLVSSSGCDSFIFLNLTVNLISQTTLPITTSCSSPSYFFKGQNRTLSGIYKDTLKNVNNCDSFVDLILTVVSPSSYTFSVTLCPGQSYFFNGQNRPTAGTYTQTLTNSVGCDSIITLTLSYLTTPTGVNKIIWACNPYMFKGKTYTSNAIVIDTVKSSFGCDSLYRFNYIYLKSTPTTLTNIPITVCDSVTIKNIVHKTSFSYTDTTRTTQNVVCDSLYQTTNYTIKYTPTITLSTKQEDTFFKGENITISAIPIAIGIKNYRWSTGETKRDISFKLTQNESIFLIAWNDPQCQDTAYTNITALDPTILEFPTGFSPSSKKPENQVFRPNILGKIERIQLEIFNRLGEKVYSSNNLASLGWDGTYKGSASPQGVYTYLIEYVTNKRIFFKSGEVELVR